MMFLVLPMHTHTLKHSHTQTPRRPGSRRGVRIRHATAPACRPAASSRPQYESWPVARMTMAMFSTHGVSRPWFCVLAITVPCDLGIFFSMWTSHVRSFEESYRTASNGAKKKIWFKFWNAPTAVLYLKLDRLLFFINYETNMKILSSVLTKCCTHTNTSHFFRSGTSTMAPEQAHQS
jgi:hypothetical protein